MVENITVRRKRWARSNSKCGNRPDKVLHALLPYNIIRAGA